MLVGKLRQTKLGRAANSTLNSYSLNFEEEALRLLP